MTVYFREGGPEPSHLTRRNLCKLFGCTPSQLRKESGIDIAEIEAAQESLIRERGRKVDRIIKQINRKKNALDPQAAVIELLKMLALEI